MSLDKAKALKNAQKYTQKGQFEKAVTEYLKLIETDPGEKTYKNFLGDLYLKQGNQESAIRAFLDAAAVYQTEGFTPHTIALYKKILRIDPNRMELYLDLGKLYADQGLIGDAITNFKVAADYYFSKGQKQQALKTYKNIVDLDPKNLNVKLRLAELYAREGMRNEAASQYAGVAEKILSSGKAAEALAYFAKAKELQPENIDALKGLIQVALSQEKPAEAVPHMEALRAAEPNNLQNLLLLGKAYVKMGRRDPAIDALEKVVAADPAQLQVHETLCRLYLERGDRTRAWNTLAPVIDTAMNQNDRQTAGRLLDEFAPPLGSEKGFLQKQYEYAVQGGDNNKRLLYGKRLASQYEEIRAVEQAVEIYRDLMPLVAPDSDVAERFRTLSAMVDVDASSAIGLSGAPLEIDLQQIDLSDLQEFGEVQVEGLEDLDLDLGTTPRAMPAMNLQSGPGRPTPRDATPSSRSSELIDVDLSGLDLGEGFGADSEVTVKGSTPASMSRSPSSTPPPFRSPSGSSSRSSTHNPPTTSPGRATSEPARSGRMPSGGSKQSGFDDFSGSDFDLDLAPQPVDDFDLGSSGSSSDDFGFGSPAKQAPSNASSDDFDFGMPSSPSSSKSGNDFDFGAPTKSSPTKSSPTKSSPTKSSPSKSGNDFDFGAPSKSTPLMPSDDFDFSMPSKPQSKSSDDFGFGTPSKSAPSKAGNDFEFGMPSNDLGDFDPGPPGKSVDDFDIELPLPPAPKAPAGRPAGTSNQAAPSPPKNPSVLEELSASVGDFNPEITIDDDFELSSPPSRTLPTESGFPDTSMDDDFDLSSALPGGARSRRDEQSASSVSDFGDLNGAGRDAGAAGNTRRLAKSKNLTALDRLGRLTTPDRAKTPDRSKTPESMKIPESVRSMQMAPPLVMEPPSPPPPSKPPSSRPSAPTRPSGPAPLDVADEIFVPPAPANDMLDLNADFFSAKEPEEAPGDLIDLGDLILGDQPVMADDEENVNELLRQLREGIEAQVSKEDYDTHYNLGIAYKEMGLLDEAIDEFRRAAGDKTRRVNCLSNIGLCYVQRGMIDQAIVEFKKGLGDPECLDEDRVGLNYELGLIYEQQGERSKAVEAYRTAAKIDATFRDLQEKLRGSGGEADGEGGPKDRVSFL